MIRMRPRALAAVAVAAWSKTTAATAVPVALSQPVTASTGSSASGATSCGDPQWIAPFLTPSTMVEVGYNKSISASCVLAGTLSEQYSADGAHWKTLTSQHETAGTSAYLQQPLLSGTFWYRGFYATDDGTYKGGSAAVQFTAFFGGLYWVGDGGVDEANLNGTDPHPIVLGQSVHNDASAVAAGGAHLYFADEFGSPGGATIDEANLDGTDTHTITFGQSWPRWLALNSSHLYWADGVSGAIDEANLDSTDPHPIVSGQGGINGVAVDSSHLYWATISGGIGTIDEANLDGTDPHPIVSGQSDQIIGVAVIG